jgi:hypothetical protein
MRVAPHVKLLRRAANVDRDRLEREFRLARRLGGVGLFGLGRFGGFLCRGGGVELRLRVGLGGVEPRPSFGGPKGGLLLQVLGPCLGLVRLRGGERLVAREAAEAAETANEAKKAAAETASLTASLRKLESLKTRVS